MTRVEECALFLLKEPEATNEEIAKELNISLNYAKKLVCDLKACGIANVSNSNGQRTIKVIEDKIKNKRVEENKTRKARIEQLLDVLFESIEQESQIENIVNAGNLIVKLLDRL